MISQTVISISGRWGGRRTFVRMRELAGAHKDLSLRIDAMEKKYDGIFQVIFKAIKLILEKPKEGPDNIRRF